VLRGATIVELGVQHRSLKGGAGGSEHSTR